MFSRSMVDYSRSKGDTSRVDKMTIISSVPSCAIILMTLEVSFTIVMFL